MTGPLGLFPLPDAESHASLLADLATALRRHRFSETASLPHPGGLSHAFFDPANIRRYLNGKRNVHEYSSVAPLFYRAHRRKNPNAVTLFEAFSVNQPVSRAALESALSGDLLRRLIEAQVLVERHGDLVSRLTVTACGDKFFSHDNTSIHKSEKMDHVFLGRCSMRLADHVAEFMRGRRLHRGLDLCTGSGVQALNIASSCDQVIGGDVNRRALAFARANARANGVNNATFVESDLFTNIPGRFDVVTANTPFLLLEEGSQALSGYGGHLGMEIELRLFEQLDAHLEPGGNSFIVASSVMISGENVLETKLRELFRDADYEIELIPITTYYAREMYDVYAQHGVDCCILYVVRLSKSGSGLRLHVRSWRPIVDVAYRLQVARLRLQGWAASRRRSAGLGADQSG